MTKLHLLLASAAALALAAPAFADDTNTFTSETKVKQDSAGNYYEKDKTTATDATGKAIAEKKVKVDVSSNGATDKTVTTENTKKRGWFDKDSVKTKDTEKTKADGTVEVSHKKVVNGTTVENTTTNATTNTASPTNATNQ